MSAGDPPIYVNDGFGVSLSGFLARPGNVPSRPEESLTFSAGALDTPGAQFYLNFSYEVMAGTAQPNMVLLDYQYEGQSIVVTLLGTDANGGSQIQVQYSTGLPSLLINTVTIPWPSQTGGINDLNPCVTPGMRNGIGIGYKCGVLSVDLIQKQGGGGVDTLLGPGAPPQNIPFDTVLGTFGSNNNGSPSPSDHLAFGDLYGGGAPVDGYIDNIEPSLCTGAPVPRFRTLLNKGQSGTATPTSVVGNNALALSKATPSPTATSATGLPQALAGLSGVIVVPNPTGSWTTVFAKMDQPAHAILDVLSLDGSLVYSRDLGSQPAGDISVRFNADTLADGIYFVVVRTSWAQARKTLGIFKLAVLH